MPKSTEMVRYCLSQNGERLNAFLNNSVPKLERSLRAGVSTDCKGAVNVTYSRRGNQPHRWCCGLIWPQLGLTQCHPCSGDPMQNKKSQGKGSKLPRAPKRAQPSKRSSRKTRSTRSFTALATNVSVEEGNTMNAVRTVRFSNSALGRPQNFEGSQFICNIVSGGTSEQGAFGTSGALVSHVIGSEFQPTMIPVAIAAVTSTGDMPQGFTGRLGVMASLFDQYRMEATVEYEPDVSANQAGNFVLAFLPDPKPDFGMTYEKAQDSIGSLVIPFRSDKKVALRLPASERVLWTDQARMSDDSSFLVGGYLYGFLGTPATAGTIYGRIRLHYRVSFFRPTLIVAPGPSESKAKVSNSEGKEVLTSSLSKTSQAPVVTIAVKSVEQPMIRVSESSSSSSSMSAPATLSDYVMVRRS